VPDEAASEFEKYARALSPYLRDFNDKRWSMESNIHCVECGAPVMWLRREQPNRWAHQVMPDGFAEPHPVVLWRSKRVSAGRSMISQMRYHMEAGNDK
jgi:hypothetical protein